MNVTDVGHLTSDEDEGEDKVEKAAKKENKTAKEITNYYFKVFKDDLKKLNIKSPNKWTKATEYIKEQIKLIKTLEEKGYTYKTSDGVYYDTSKFKDYGKFSRIGKQEAGKRVSMKEKKNITDFALWKFSEPNVKRQQEWDSPWGKGYPGWHIECSAMAMKELGKTIDIHTGGQEHIQVHHQNEIAQSEVANNQKFVNYWMHTAWLTTKGEKISKSKGGLFTISELEKKNFPSLAFRYLCLTAHYKKPLDFSLDSLEAAKTALNNLKDKVLNLKNKDEIKTKVSLLKNYKETFNEKINNDLNIPEALATLWDLLKEKDINNQDKYKLILEFDEVLGLNLKELKQDKINKDVESLIEERETARKNKDYQKSDEIRDALLEQGIVLEDTKSGVKWKKKS
jgi:cysteinyl-tRNA synthetase